MRRLPIAIVGFGRLGRACIEALSDANDLELAGVIRRPESPAKLPSPFQRVKVVQHAAELGMVHAALLCVPAPLVRGVAEEILQRRIPIVECAQLEGEALADHHQALDAYARRHKVSAVVGAGWDPGAMPLIQRIFERFIPAGQTTIANRPGASLHHTAVAEGIAGVKGALATEYRSADGRNVYYVYVELQRDTDIDSIRQAIQTEPPFVGEQVIVLPVESVAALEEAGRGVLIERRGLAKSGPHPTLLLEARFNAHSFAARAMVDAVHLLPGRTTGALRYTFGL